MGYRACTHTLVHALKYVQTLDAQAYTHKHTPEQESHSALACMKAYTMWPLFNQRKSYSLLKHIKVTVLEMAVL